MALPVALGILIGKVAIGAWAWHRAVRDAWMSDADQHICDFLSHLDPELIGMEPGRDEMADMIRRQYPLPGMPGRMIFPNGSRMVAPPNGAGEFALFVWHTPQAEPLIIATGYDHRKRFRMLPVIGGAGHRDWRRALNAHLVRLHQPIGA